MGGRYSWLENFKDIEAAASLRVKGNLPLLNSLPILSPTLSPSAFAKASADKRRGEGE